MPMQQLVKKILPGFFLLVLLATGCRKQEEIVPIQNPSLLPSKAQLKNDPGKFDSYIAQSWYNLALQLVLETPGHTPPIAARSFGYMGITLYEVIVDDMPHRHSLIGQLNGLASLPKRVYGNSYLPSLTANAALARIIKDLFPNASASNMDKIAGLELQNEKVFSEKTSPEIAMRSSEYGRSVADAVFNWSASDGGNNAYLANFPTDFISPTGVDKWVPTGPAFQSAMLPYWGNNRPMVAANGPGPVDPPGPPAFSDQAGSEFYNAAYEVYNTSLHLTSEQNMIGLYWADGPNTFTPPGHNLAIALQMIRNYKMNLYDASILLAKVGIALNDAGIVCWRAKYLVNLIRPVTYIQRYIDPAWNSSIGTPPFPSYTSGHSTFSGASAGILTAEFGRQVFFTDSSKIAHGFLPRSFNSFNEAAQEAAISRLYGGIHYMFDNDHGFNCGQLVAMNVDGLNW